ncbi:hypothetical protein L208DRAFT_1465370 [Tricholoma matsutake]|nr:hypothetical protein L208DRAFT_1465370 [Tricholoma matsutake 945]
MGTWCSWLSRPLSIRSLRAVPGSIPGVSIPSRRGSFVHLPLGALLLSGTAVYSPAQSLNILMPGDFHIPASARGVFLLFVRVPGKRRTEYLCEERKVEMVVIIQVIGLRSIFITNMDVELDSNEGARGSTGKIHNNSLVDPKFFCAMAKEQRDSSKPSTEKANPVSFSA